MRALFLLAFAYIPADADPSLHACFLAVDDTVEAMRMPGIEVDLTYGMCGELNAAYDGNRHRLIICTELLEQDPLIIRAVVAHEMAHAIVDQYKLPVVGSEEAAADELSAVVLGLTGHADAVEKMSELYNGLEDATEDVEDDHQSNPKRAAVFACLARGADPNTQDFTCRSRFVHAAQAWIQLIQVFGPR